MSQRIVHNMVLRALQEGDEVLTSENSVFSPEQIFPESPGDQSLEFFGEGEEKQMDTAQSNEDEVSDPRKVLTHLRSAPDGHLD